MHAPTRTSPSRHARRVFALATAALLVAAIAALTHGAAARMLASAASGDDPTAVVASALDAAPSAADGVVGSRVSVFDEVPAVSGLDADLLAAVRAAARDAADDGVRFVVNSGWRSARLQERLLDDAVTRYGSREEAARWVATPETSAHVTGEAIDLGPWDALDWLAQRGADYGLCQIYANEPWHYELRPAAKTEGCPSQYPDPTHDPRLQ